MPAVILALYAARLALRRLAARLHCYEIALAVAWRRVQRLP